METINVAEKKTTRFQVLSLDGGGIKGMFSAAVLAYLEEALEIRITDHFDLITGTSTGGIIALGLSYGMRPKEIVNFYEQYGPSIFSGSWAEWKLRDVRWLFRSKYRGDGLKKALQECFGDATLGQCNIPVAIPTYSLVDHGVCIFKTDHHERLRSDYKQPIWKVAMATAAAPTYLPTVTSINDVRLIDGGVWANNPVVLGIAEAVSMFGADLRNIRVLSIGTTSDLCRRPTWLDKGGAILWAKAGAEVFIEAQTTAANGLACHLVGPDNILRLNPYVAAREVFLDRPSAKQFLAKAATESRSLSPKVKEMFADHFAAKPTFYYR